MRPELVRRVEHRSDLDVRSDGHQRAVPERDVRVHRRELTVKSMRGHDRVLNGDGTAAVVGG
jgi:hypothetical protein